MAWVSLAWSSWMARPRAWNRLSATLAARDQRVASQVNRAVLRSASAERRAARRRPQKSTSQVTGKPRLSVVMPRNCTGLKTNGLLDALAGLRSVLFGLEIWAVMLPWGLL